MWLFSPTHRVREGEKERERESARERHREKIPREMSSSRSRPLGSHQGEVFARSPRSQSDKEPILGLMHLRPRFYDRPGDRRLLAKIERHLGHCRGPPCARERGGHEAGQRRRARREKRESRRGRSAESGSKWFRKRCPPTRKSAYAISELRLAPQHAPRRLPSSSRAKETDKRSSPRERLPRASTWISECTRDREFSRPNEANLSSADSKSAASQVTLGFILARFLLKTICVNNPSPSLFLYTSFRKLEAT